MTIYEKNKKSQTSVQNHKCISSLRFITQKINLQIKVTDGIHKLYCKECNGFLKENKRMCDAFWKKINPE